MKVIFFGTSDFSAKILSFLVDQGVQIVAIVTKPDRPRGRSQKILPSRVKRYAEQNHPNIPLLAPPKASTLEVAEKLSTFEPDLFLVVSYGEIIKQSLLDIPKMGSINIHTSLLPKYRGAAPIQRALIEGEKETGVTIMEMVLELDAGDILEVEKVPIPEEMTLGELEQALCRAAFIALKKVLKAYQTGSIKKKPQDSTQATYAKKITPEECQIHWDEEAIQIHNLIRGVSPKPGAWCMISFGQNPKRMKILRAQISSQSGKPGEILEYGKKNFIVGCGKNSLQITELQLEGKKSMQTFDFMKGFPQPRFADN